MTQGPSQRRHGASVSIRALTRSYPQSGGALVALEDVSIDLAPG